MIYFSRHLTGRKRHRRAESPTPDIKVKGDKYNKGKFSTWIFQRLKVKKFGSCLFSSFIQTLQMIQITLINLRTRTLLEWSDFLFSYCMLVLFRLGLFWLPQVATRSTCGSSSWSCCRTDKFARATLNGPIPTPESSNWSTPRQWRDFGANTRTSRIWIMRPWAGH